MKSFSALKILLQSFWNLIKVLYDIVFDSDHISIDLAIRTAESTGNFLQRDYILYDCSVHNT